MSVEIDGVQFVPRSMVEAVEADRDIWRRAASVAHAHLWTEDVEQAVRALRAETGLTAADARAMCDVMRWGREAKREARS